MSDRAAEDAGAPDEAPAPGPVKDVRRFLPLIGLFVAFWATLPKYSGPFLNTEDLTETVDHILPGILVLIVSVVALLASRKASPDRPTALPFFCGMAVLLAGFFMLATHVPLILEATRGEAPWDATVYHSSSAAAVFGLGLLWTVMHWSDLGAIEAAEADKKAAATSE